MLALRSCAKLIVNCDRYALRSLTAAHVKFTIGHLPTQSTSTTIDNCVKFATRSYSTYGQQRIYYGSLAPRMRAVKMLSLTTSVVGLAAQPILVEQGMKLGGAGMAVALCTIGGFFTFVTPLLLHFVTKKYVTEMYYNPATNEYTAMTVSLLLQKVETKFRPNDVTVPEVPGMFTSFMIGKKPLFVDPALFEDPEHYVRIMGYDKPVDFKLDLKQSPIATSRTTKAQQDTKK